MFSAKHEQLLSILLSQLFHESVRKGIEGGVRRKKRSLFKHYDQPYIELLNLKLIIL